MSHLVLVASRNACPSLTGRWRSSRSAAGARFDIEFTASEEDGEVRGHGEFAVGSVRGVRFALSGRHEHPSIRVVLQASGIEEASFGGTFVSADLVHGRLTGSGFAGLPVLLKRAS